MNSYGVYTYKIKCFSENSDKERTITKGFLVADSFKNAAEKIENMYAEELYEIISLKQITDCDIVDTETVEYFDEVFDKIEKEWIW